MTTRTRTTMGRLRLAAALLSLAGCAALTATATARQDDPDPDRRERRAQRGNQDDPGRAERPGRGQRRGGFLGGQERRREFRGGPQGGFGQRRGGGGPGGISFEPDFLRRDMRLFIDLLELDDDQSSIVEALLLDYETSFAEASEAMRDRIGDLMPKREEDPERNARRRDLGEQMRALGRELRELRRVTAQDEGERDKEAQEAAQVRVDEIRQKFEVYRDEMVALRPQMPQGEELEQLREDMRRLRNQWRLESNTLASTFLANLRSVLNEEQDALWPAFERTLRRQKTLSRGRLSGERVNLFLILREVGLGDRDMNLLSEVLDEYALILDHALVARNDHLDVARDEIVDAMRAGDMETALDLTAREAELRTAVRDLTQSYAEAIAMRLAEMMNDEMAESFRLAVRERAFPRIFRPTIMQRSFAVAASFDDLDEETLEAVESLERNYLVDLALRNDALVRITREEEPKRNQQRLERRIARMNGEQRERPSRDENPMNVAYRDRTELDRTIRGRLENLLTPEQIELLPEMRQPRQRGRGGENFFGRRGRDMTAEERAEMRKRFMEEFDKDGDGEISEEEREAIRERFRGRRRGGGGGEGGGEGRGRRGEPIT